MTTAAVNPRISALNRLKKLPPTQFEEVMAYYDEIRSYLPSEKVGQVQRAIALLEHISAQGELAQLPAVIDRVAPAAGAAVENIPNDLIYFLADRGEQEDRLGEALRAWDGQQPFLCITYGCHSILQERFIERILEYFFPDNSQLPEKLHDLGNGCPRQLRYLRALDKLHAELDAELSHFEQKIRYENHRRPVIHFDLNSKEWFGNRRRNTVTEFVVYWKNAGIIAETTYAPLIFLSFQYLPERLKYLAWLPGFSRDVAAIRWLRQHANQDHRDFQKTFGLPGVILPELTAIDCADAERWANLEAVKACYPHIPTRNLQWRIHQTLYPTRQERLPMSHLGAGLHDKVILSFTERSTP